MCCRLATGRRHAVDQDAKATAGQVQTSKERRLDKFKLKVGPHEIVAVEKESQKEEQENCQRHWWGSFDLFF